MNVKAWIPLIVAIALGLVAALFASKLTTQTPAASSRLGGTTEVVVANRMVNPGDELKLEDLGLAPINAKDAPEGTFGAVTELTGRIATVPMVKGQAILETCLAPSGAAAGIQALVPEGMRLISLEVNEFSGLSGMLVPGSFVDIISTIHQEGEDLMARTIAQSVQVKAVGTRINPQDKPEPDAPMTRSVTLLVTPAQAETLELAVVTMRNSGAGLPWLVLRAPQDKVQTTTEGVTIVDLRGGVKGNNAFESRPVMDVQPVAGATTRPTRLIEMPADIDEQTNPEQREVTIIRGGVETKVMLEVRKPDAMMTSNETGFIGK